MDGVMCPKVKYFSIRDTADLLKDRFFLELYLSPRFKKIHVASFITGLSAGIKKKVFPFFIFQNNIISYEQDY